MNRIGLGGFGSYITAQEQAKENSSMINVQRKALYSCVRPYYKAFRGTLNLSRVHVLVELVVLG